MAWSSDLTVAFTALFISGVTLIFIILQLLLQGLSLASGYSNCGKKVMGGWGKATRLKLNWLRPEVHFDAPVIFIAPPRNKKVPVEGRPTWIVNGSAGSYSQTQTDKDEGQYPSEPDERAIHTINSERATWLTLLSALQFMEDGSIKWQKELYPDHEKNHFSACWQKDPPDILLPGDQNAIDPQAVDPQDALLEMGWGKRTLSVAIQSKTRSWYSIPNSVQKPYATTTLCHLVEVAAVLGLHWREFNQDSDHYRADGNGYVLSGAMHAGFGLVFSFSKVGHTKFQENRLIPVNEIKELCFGYVPTIFRDAAEFPPDGCLKWPLDAEKKADLIHTLQLGTPRALSTTLALMGCNVNTQYYFLDQSARRGHLFLVAFELIGMLAKPLQIKKTSFRMLPNPTYSNWDCKAFDLSRLLTAFSRHLQEEGDKSETQCRIHTGEIVNICAQIESKNTKDDVLSYGFLDLLHDAIDQIDKYLTDNPAHTREVVRRHMDEVMRRLNENNGSGDENIVKQFDTATSVQKEEALMDIYFHHVRAKVGAGFSTASPKLAPKPAESQESHELDEVKADEIWCKLILRMLCWLMLHDFNKKDVQDVRYPKSELLGSRLPVYII